MDINLGIFREDGGFEEHMMYDSQKAETPKEHLMLKADGYTHDSPNEYSPYKMRTPFKCWEKYKQVGYKKKGGRTVPNCVPK